MTRHQLKRALIRFQEQILFVPPIVPATRMMVGSYGSRGICQRLQRHDSVAATEDSLRKTCHHKERSECDERVGRIGRAEARVGAT